MYRQVKSSGELPCKALGALRHVVGVTVGVARHAYHQRVGLPFLDDGGYGGKARIAFGGNSFQWLGGASEAVAYGYTGAPGAKVKG